MNNNRSSNIGGVSAAIYHCIFHSGSITHYLHDFEPDFIAQLPHLYAVCIANRVNDKRNVIGGFFLKTSYTHQDPEFQSACKAAMATMKEITPLLDSVWSLLPARVSINGSNQAPLTVDEMNVFILKQYIKFQEVGQA